MEINQSESIKICLKQGKLHVIYGHKKIWMHIKGAHHYAGTLVRPAWLDQSRNDNDNLRYTIGWLSSWHRCFITNRKHPEPAQSKNLSCFFFQIILSRKCSESLPNFNMMCVMLRLTKTVKEYGQLTTIISLRLHITFVLGYTPIQFRPVLTKISSNPLIMWTENS